MHVTNNEHPNEEQTKPSTLCLPAQKRRQQDKVTKINKQTNERNEINIFNFWD